MIDERVPPGIIHLTRERESFLICGHVRPDADCIGSQLALSRALTSLGRRPEIWLPDAVPANCRFLPGSEAIRKPGASARAFDVAFVLDTPRPERMGPIAAAVMEVPEVVNVDHHPSNINWASHNWVDAGAAATAELIYLLMKALGVPIDLDTATCLYTGIITDTGRFCYRNTTPFTHRMAGELLAIGLSPEAVADRLYAQNRPEKMRLLGPVLGTLSLHEGGALACVWIKREMFERSGALPEDTEGFVNCARDLAGVKVAVLLEEQPDGKGVRVSMRSRDSLIDVNTIAAHYGGGGHRAAAGALIPGDPKQIERRLLDDVRTAIARARDEERHPHRE
jgi:phosphoesterase RecJ-like protein